MQTETAVNVTLPLTSDLVKNLGAEPKSLQIGDEINLVGKVSASDESGVTLELTSATKPVEPGTPESPEMEAGEGMEEGGGEDTSKATDFVKKQRQMAA